MDAMNAKTHALQQRAAKNSFRKGVNPPLHTEQTGQLAFAGHDRHVLQRRNATFVLNLPRHRKIEVLVQATVGIEGRAAIRAGVGSVQVIANCHFATTGAAKDGLLVPLAFRPGRERMIGQRIVAILAGVVEPATFHPDRHDIARRVPVCTARLRIETEAVDVNRHAIRVHG